MKSKKLIKYLIATYEKALIDLQGELAGLKSQISEMNREISILKTGMNDAYDNARDNRKLIKFIFDGDDQLIIDILNNKRKNWKEQTESGKPDLFTKDPTIDFTKDYEIDVPQPPIFEVMADEKEDSKDWVKPIVKKNSEDKFNIPDES